MEPEPLILVHPLTGHSVVVDTPVGEFRLRAEGYHEPGVVPSPVVPRPVDEAEPEPEPEPAVEPEPEHEPAVEPEPESDEDKGKRRR